jgi:hypothetical protein
MIGLLVSNMVLWTSPLYRLALISQFLFYLWAGVGFVFHQRMRQVRYALIGYYLVAMHLAFLVGFVRFLFAWDKATWQRVN